MIKKMLIRKKIRDYFFDRNKFFMLANKKLVYWIFGLSPKKKIMAYFSSGARENTFDYLNFDETKDIMDDLVKVAKKIDYQLVIKSHPTFYQAREWCNANIKGEYCLITARAATPILLSMADILIITKSITGMKALSYNMPKVVFTHSPRKIPLYENQKLFLRAVGYKQLLEICEKSIS